jgi:hypothetical protein
MANSQTNYGILRLKSKDARSAIIQKLATDFNLTPIIAEAFFSAVLSVFSTTCQCFSFQR